ncbi:MAG: VOC family protein [Planctomycetaceae bacterium]|nr:VOC family protein [Planctomycetaceae bacterium]
MLGPLCEAIIYVADMDAQVRFYRDLLGLKVASPADRDSFSDEYWVTFQTGECTLALHGGGHQDFGRDAPKFVFRVEDVATVRETLISRGVPFGEIRSPAPGVQVADGTDPEGNVFAIESAS